MGTAGNKFALVLAAYEYAKSMHVTSVLFGAIKRIYYPGVLRVVVYEA